MTPISQPWYRRIGPGIITACVVIGPGSILTSSKVGATYGYGMGWVVILAVAFMLTFVTLGAKLGVVARQSPGDLIRSRIGSWLAILAGLSAFLISASFQFGNNLGARAAFIPFVGTSASWVASVLIVLLNALALLFLFSFKNVYKALERLMMFFVGMMLLAFALNLIAAKPNIGPLLKGIIGFGKKPSNMKDVGVDLVGLFGTTFVVTAAFYQIFLAQQKGWTKDQLSSTLLDSRIGCIIMAMLTLMILSTAGTVLAPKAAASEIEVDKLQLPDVAKQLSPLLKNAGQIVFCVGLFCAAYSSFLVNSMIGGFILSDGLGLGSQADDKWPKILTTVVLLTGMIVALLVVQFDVKSLYAIVLGQAVTVIGAPLLAGTLIWLSNRRDVMGEDRPGIAMNVLAGIGFVLALVLAFNTILKVKGNLDKLF